MSIAIFRHWKLCVALPLEYPSPIKNFHPRRMHYLRTQWDTEPRYVVELSFTKIDRRGGLLINHDEIWRCVEGEVSIINQTRRNGSLQNRIVRPCSPAYAMAWTENGVVNPVYDQFEQEISSRVIIERYLHHNVPNPYSYKVVEVDLKPEHWILGLPVKNAYKVRSPEEVEIAARTDRSEDSQKWAELFLA